MGNCEFVGTNSSVQRTWVCLLKGLNAVNRTWACPLKVAALNSKNCDAGRFIFPLLCFCGAYLEPVALRGQILAELCSWSVFSFTLRGKSIQTGSKIHPILV